MTVTSDQMLAQQAIIMMHDGIKGMTGIDAVIHSNDTGIYLTLGHKDPMHLGFTDPEKRKDKLNCVYWLYHSAIEMVWNKLSDCKEFNRWLRSL